jgi:hypothetical protein
MHVYLKLIQLYVIFITQIDILGQTQYVFGFQELIKHILAELCDI